MSYIAKNGRLYTSGASEALTLLDDKFSVNKSYSKGDSCIYNDYLWKFTSDKPAGEWDSSVVEQCRIMDFVDDINGRLTQSFVEHEVGTYIDASGISHKMYEKTFNCGALPDNDIKEIPFGSTYSKILSISGIAYSVQGHSTAIPAAWKGSRGSNTLTSCLIYVAEGNVKLNTFSNMSTFYTNSEVTVRYIKD